MADSDDAINAALGLGENREAVYDVSVELSAVLGTANLPIAQLLKLGRGAVVELDRKVNDPVDLYVNRKKVCRAEVVVVEDHLAVTITEVLKRAAD
ncbi:MULTISPECIES: flagellar motor switch protein FliN [Rhodospirillales]|uniref:Flagellar motor switch protein FliN n=1 Tax=Paramagnetospirillum caucaseum TaxID=1244869 RepID=M2Y5X9_9PROT|nr:MULTISPECIES: flagellar motor switch protein FliN [Rhodospirillales]EME68476.1 Flagellar motor switch protein FliN [Paramagnetospirillum caucaseum]